MDILALFTKRPENVDCQEMSASFFQGRTKVSLSFNSGGGGEGAGTSLSYTIITPHLPGAYSRYNWVKSPIFCAPP